MFLFFLLLQKFQHFLGFNQFSKNLILYGLWAVLLKETKKFLHKFKMYWYYYLCVYL